MTDLLLGIVLKIVENFIYLVLSNMQMSENWA